VDGSGNKLCGALSVLFQAAAHHPPTASHLLSQALCTESSREDQLLAPPLFSSMLRTPYPLLHVLFSSLFIIIIFFLRGRGQSVQGAMLVYPRGNCGNTMCCLSAHLLVFISQAGLEPVSGSVGALLFSQCNVSWRSFVWTRGLRSQSFASSWCFFFSAKCGSSISVRFLIYGAHTACFLPLVTILDPLLMAAEFY
jgi:hypothetical protein